MTRADYAVLVENSILFYQELKRADCSIALAEWRCPSKRTMSCVVALACAGVACTGLAHTSSRFCFHQGADNVDEFIRLLFINILALDHGALERETTNSARVLYNTHSQFLIQKIIQWTDNQAGAENWRQKHAEHYARWVAEGGPWFCVKSRPLICPLDDQLKHTIRPWTPDQASATQGGKIERRN